MLSKFIKQTRTQETQTTVTIIGLNKAKELNLKLQGKTNESNAEAYQDMNFPLQAYESMIRPKLNTSIRLVDHDFNKKI
jgi:hypothetical protein